MASPSCGTATSQVLWSDGISRKCIYPCYNHAQVLPAAATLWAEGHVLLSDTPCTFSIPSTCSDPIKKTFCQAARCNLVHAQHTARCLARVCLQQTAWRTVLGPGRRR